MLFLYFFLVCKNGKKRIGVYLVFILRNLGRSRVWDRPFLMPSNRARTDETASFQGRRFAGLEDLLVFFSSGETISVTPFERGHLFRDTF